MQILTKAQKPVFNAQKTEHFKIPQKSYEIISENIYSDVTFERIKWLLSEQIS